MCIPRRVIAIFFLIAVHCATHAETIQIGPKDDWFTMLSSNGLQPGDEVVLRSGTYSDSRRLTIRHSGAAGKPITIRAAAGEKVVFKRPDAKQNTFNLEGCRHLRLIGLEITGGAAGIRIAPLQDVQPNNVVLEGLHIHHIGGVAVTCNHEGGRYHHMTFRGNHIHHTAGHGEAFYLGGNHATAIISDSIVENNYIHHLNGDHVSQGDGIEIKQGSFGNRIVGNVIHDTKYPGITVYGTAGKARNVIENNLIWNSDNNGIQAAADAIIRGNFIANAASSGIYSREHQGAKPGNLRIEGNEVIAKRGSAVRVTGGQQGTANAKIELINNRLFARNAIAIRIDNKITVTAKQNRGLGNVTGWSPTAQAWKTDATDRTPTLPALNKNPVWNHLNRQAVEQTFGRGR